MSVLGVNPNRVGNLFIKSGWCCNASATSNAGFGRRERAWHQDLCGADWSWQLVYQKAVGAATPALQAMQALVGASVLGAKSCATGPATSDANVTWLILYVKLNTHAKVQSFFFRF